VTAAPEAAVKAGAMVLRQNCSQTPPSVGTIRVFAWALARCDESPPAASAAMPIMAVRLSSFSIEIHLSP